MSVKITNNAVTILASGINAVQTTLTVNAGTGSLFPSLTGNDVFYITVSSAANPALFEIMLVTARSADTLTVVRAQDGTTAKSFSASDVVASLQNAAVFAWLRQYTTIPTSTGSANAQAVANTVPFPAAPGLGAVQVIMPGFTNTGSMTLNVDAFGAVTAKCFGQDLQSGMVVTGVIAVLRHDGTNWELINPQVPYAQVPTATGTGNAQVVANTANPIKTLIAGVRTWFKPVAANTGPATLNQDGTGATTVRAWNKALIGGEMAGNAMVEAVHDGNVWELVNPFITAIGLANGALEATVFTANGTFTPIASANYLVIAIGGGGGGGGAGGGTAGVGGGGGFGGAGGVLGFSTVSLTAGTGYAVVIGTGGALGSGGAAGNSGSDGTAGNPTTFNAVTIAAGGTGGKGGVLQAGSNNGSGQRGSTGGGNGGAIGGASGGGVGGTAANNTGGGGGGGGGGNNAAAGGNGGVGGSGLLVVIRA